jgi:hypothetical protein
VATRPLSRNSLVTLSIRRYCSMVSLGGDP